MKIEVKEIPTVQKEYHYIASDGTDFTDQWKCEQYERRLGYKDEPVIETAVENFRDYYDETCPAILYDITNEHDWEVLTERVWFNRQNIKKYPGPGQYLAVYNDGGDGAPWYTVYNAESYMEEILEEAHYYCSNLQDAIDTIINR